MISSSARGRMTICGLALGQANHNVRKNTAARRISFRADITLLNKIRGLWRVDELNQKLNGPPSQLQRQGRERVGRSNRALARQIKKVVSRSLFFFYILAPSIVWVNIVGGNFDSPLASRHDTG